MSKIIPSILVFTIALMASGAGAAAFYKEEYLNCAICVCLIVMCIAIMCNLYDKR